MNASPRGRKKVGVWALFALIAACVLVILPGSQLLLGSVTSISSSTAASTTTPLTYATSISTSTSTSTPNLPHSNVLLLGQFNYDTGLNHIIGWVDAWSTYFAHIVVVGPFPNATRLELAKHNISNRHGRNDAGIVSPYENLMNALLEYKDDPTIEAVLYVHDDALLNVTKLARGHDRFPTDHMVSTFQDKNYVKQLAYRMAYDKDTNTSSYWTASGTKVGSQESLIQRLKPWNKFKLCMDAQLQLIQKNTPAYYEYAQFAEPDGSFYFHGFAQADMMLVPTKYAELFAQAARPHIDQMVHLECALPTIAYQVQRMEMASNNNKHVDASPSRTASLCTSWEYYEVRGTLKMLQTCINKRPVGYDMYHPFKIGKFGSAGYKEWLHRVQKPNLGRKKSLV
jgi:hypothetical protein